MPYSNRHPLPRLRQTASGVNVNSGPGPLEAGNLFRSWESGPAHMPILVTEQAVEIAYGSGFVAVGAEYDAELPEEEPPTHEDIV